MNANMPVPPDFVLKQQIAPKTKRAVVCLLVATPQRRRKIRPDATRVAACAMLASALYRCVLSMGWSYVPALLKKSFVSCAVNKMGCVLQLTDWQRYVTIKVPTMYSQLSPCGHLATCIQTPDNTDSS